MELRYQMGEFFQIADCGVDLLDTSIKIRGLSFRQQLQRLLAALVCIPINPGHDDPSFGIPGDFDFHVIFQPI